MPLGLCNAPTTFQRLMDRSLNDLWWTHCLIYFNDIIVITCAALEMSWHYSDKLVLIRRQPEKFHNTTQAIHFDQLKLCLTEQDYQSLPEQKSVQVIQKLEINNSIWLSVWISWAMLVKFHLATSYKCATPSKSPPISTTSYWAFSLLKYLHPYSDVNH